MLTHFGTDLLDAEWKECVACIGTFDGVHLGHRAIIRKAVELGVLSERPTVLVTFDRHPYATLSPDRCPLAVNTLQQNLDQFRALKVAACVVLRFDSSLAAMEAERFVDEVLCGRLKTAQLVVGHDFALGRGRVGTADWLSHRIPTEVVPEVKVEGRRVRSTLVRNAVTEGRVEDAEFVLGRPFAIPGVVVTGNKLGRTLGYPTANLARSCGQVVPTLGVYAGYGQTPFGRYRAAISVGIRPTVGGGARTIEGYLLDYPGDSLYGMSIELQFSRYLRPEEKYPSLQALCDQMALDVMATAVLPPP